MRRQRRFPFCSGVCSPQSTPSSPGAERRRFLTWSSQCHPLWIIPMNWRNTSLHCQLPGAIAYKNRPSRPFYRHSHENGNPEPPAYLPSFPRQRESVAPAPKNPVHPVHPCWNPRPLPPVTPKHKQNPSSAPATPPAFVPESAHPYPSAAPSTPAPPSKTPLPPPPATPPPPRPMRHRRRRQPIRLSRRLQRHITSRILH